MSTNERKKIPDAPTPAQPAGASGNLLSSVAPPSQLPNFVTSNPTPLPVTLAPQLPPQLAATLAPAPAAISAPSPGESAAPLAAVVAPPAVFTPITTAPAVLQATTPEKFSPAIPPSKGEPMMSIRSPEDSQATQSPESLPDSLADVDRIGDIMPGSALFTWVKGAVSSGGLLQRVAEKAKSSVDSMITTLDPQMKEYLNSGGDVNIVVASDKDVKISPVREAFQAIFGKATVTGYAAESDVTAAQPVGYAAAYAAAKQRIAHIRSAHTEVHNNVPIVAVEGFLHEAVPDRWYMLDLLVLSQPSLGIELQAQGQGCGVPPAVVAAARAATAPDYTHAQTGFSTTAASIMAASLQVAPTQWHEASTGVARRELILLAARSLAGSYKRLLAVSAAEEVCKIHFFVMKLATVFAAVLAVAAAAPTTCWNLQDLSIAAEHHGTPARFRPYLEQALNELMLAIFTGQHEGPVTIETPDGLLSVEEAAPIPGAVKPPRRRPPVSGPEMPAHNITRLCAPQPAASTSLP